MERPRELTLKYTLSFKKSKEKAFAYLRQISRRKEFMMIVDKTIITKKVQGDNLKGTHFKETTHFLGFDMNLEYEIVGFTEGKLIAVKCNDGPFFPFMETELLDGNEESCTAQVTVNLKLVPSGLCPGLSSNPLLSHRQTHPEKANQPGKFGVTALAWNKSTRCSPINNRRVISFAMAR